MCTDEEREEHDRNVKITEIRLGIRVNGLESHGANLSIVLDCRDAATKEW